MKTIALAGLAASTLLATAASAQTPVGTTSWTGPYVGGRIGYGWQYNDNDEQVLFDTNRDGNFGDTVRTAAGANAFSPGFCGGLALTSARSAGCRADTNAVEYTVQAGYDYQIGSNIVVGGVVEYGNANINDYTAAFSTTPANYSLSRGLRGYGTARLRAGYAVDILPGASTLFYVTGGGAYGRVRNRFTTTNLTNAFSNPDGSNALTDSYKDSRWGYAYGAGIEHKIGRFSIGAMYLRTTLRDNDYRVDVTRGSSPATNPFILQNSAGTVMKRQFRDFGWQSVTINTAFRF